MDPKTKFIVYWGFVLSMVTIAVTTLILTGIAFKISFSVPLAVGIIFTISAAVWNEFIKGAGAKEKKEVYYQFAPPSELKKLDETEIDAEIIKTIILHQSWFHYAGYFLLSIIFLIIVSVSFNKEFIFPGYRVFDYIGTFFSIPGYIILDCIGYFFMVASIITILNVILKKFSHTYIVTPNVVREKKGIISINEKEIRVHDIHEVIVKQDMFQRILNIGSIFFYSAAASGITIVFEGVENPMNVKEQVNKIRRCGD